MNRPLDIIGLYDILESWQEKWHKLSFEILAVKRLFKSSRLDFRHRLTVHPTPTINQIPFLNERVKKFPFPIVKKRAQK